MAALQQNVSAWCDSYGTFDAARMDLLFSPMKGALKWRLENRDEIGGYRTSLRLGYRTSLRLSATGFTMISKGSVLDQKMFSGVHCSMHEGSRKVKCTVVCTRYLEKEIYRGMIWNPGQGVQILGDDTVHACRGRHESRCLQQNDLRRIRSWPKDVLEENILSHETPKVWQQFCMSLQRQVVCDR